MRVVVAKAYNRALARPLYNCPSCFEKKEQQRASEHGDDATRLSERGSRADASHMRKVGG